MTLGQHFPEELLRQRLAPGRILHLYCHFASKEKFVVLGSVDPSPLVLVINSRMHPFVANRSELAQCQVLIDQASHEFLSHDSFVACHEVNVMDLHEIHEQIRLDPSRIKTIVSDNVRGQIIAAIKHARTISIRYQTQVITALENDN